MGSENVEMMGGFIKKKFQFTTEEMVKGFTTFLRKK
jgi:hypothetical protein